MKSEKQLKKQLDGHREKVDVENFDLTLGELLRMAEAKELIRAPAFQRKFRWKTDDESYLIESLLLGLPVPNVYVAANDDGTWEVVDGLQRISTLLHFMTESQETLTELGHKEPLTLVGLTTLEDFNGVTYASLPGSLRLYFSKRSIRVTSLSDKSDPEVRYEVFERLNKGGVVLTPQEVRACVHRGPFAELLRELAAYQPFHKMVKLQKSKENDGTREELVLKFFAYLAREEEFSGEVKLFLNRYMKDCANSFDVVEGRKLFKTVSDQLFAIVDGPFVRDGYANTPLNQFEAAMVAAGRIVERGKRLKKPVKGWLNDEALVESSTKGTNTPSVFRRRNERAEELLTGHS